LLANSQYGDNSHDRRNEVTAFLRKLVSEGTDPSASSDIVSLGLLAAEILIICPYLSTYAQYCAFEDEKD